MNYSNLTAKKTQTRGDAFFRGILTTSIGMLVLIACESGQKAPIDTHYVPTIHAAQFRTLARADSFSKVLEVNSNWRLLAVHFADLEIGGDFQYGAEGESAGPINCRTPAYARDAAFARIRDNFIEVKSETVGCGIIEALNDRGESFMIKVAVFDAFAQAMSAIQKALLRDAQTSIESAAINAGRIRNLELNVTAVPGQTGIFQISNANRAGDIAYLAAPTEHDRRNLEFIQTYARGLGKEIQQAPLSNEVAQTALQAFNRRNHRESDPSRQVGGGNGEPAEPTDLSGTKYEFYWGFSPSETQMMNILFRSISSVGTKENIPAVNALDPDVRSAFYDQPSDPFLPLFMNRNPAVRGDLGSAFVWNTQNPSYPKYDNVIANGSGYLSRQPFTGNFFQSWLDFYKQGLRNGLATNKSHFWGPKENLHLERSLGENRISEDRQYWGLVNFGSVQEAMIHRLAIQAHLTAIFHNDQSAYLQKMRSFSQLLSADVCDQGTHARYAFPKTLFPYVAGDNYPLNLLSQAIDCEQPGGFQIPAGVISGVQPNDFLRLKIYPDGSATLMFLIQATASLTTEPDLVYTTRPLNDLILISLKEQNYFNPQTDLSRTLALSPLTTPSLPQSSSFSLATYMKQIQYEILNNENHYAHKNSSDIQPLVFKRGPLPEALSANALDVALPENYPTSPTEGRGRVGAIEGHRLDLSALDVTGDSYIIPQINEESDRMEVAQYNRRHLYCHSQTSGADADIERCASSRGAWWGSQQGYVTVVNDQTHEVSVIRSSQAFVQGQNTIAREVQVWGKYANGTPNGEEITCDNICNGTGVIPNQVRPLGEGWQMFLGVFGNNHEAGFANPPIEFLSYTPLTVWNVRRAEMSALLEPGVLADGSEQRLALQASRDYLQLSVNQLIASMSASSSVYGPLLPTTDLQNLNLIGSNAYLNRFTAYGGRLANFDFTMFHSGSPISGFLCEGGYDNDSGHSADRVCEDEFRIDEAGNVFAGAACEIPFAFSAEQSAQTAYTLIQNKNARLRSEPTVEATAVSEASVDKTFKITGNFGNIGINSVGLLDPAAEGFSLYRSVVAYDSLADNRIVGSESLDPFRPQMLPMPAGAWFIPTVGRQGWHQMDRLPAVTIATRAKAEATSWGLLERMETPDGELPPGDEGDRCGDFENPADTPSSPGGFIFCNAQGQCWIRFFDGTIYPWTPAGGGGYPAACPPGFHSLMLSCVDHSNGGDRVQWFQICQCNEAGEPNSPTATNESCAEGGEICLLSQDGAGAACRCLNGDCSGEQAAGPIDCASVPGYRPQNPDGPNCGYDIGDPYNLDDDSSSYCGQGGQVCPPGDIWIPPQATPGSSNQGRCCSAESLNQGNVHDCRDHACRGGIQRPWDPETILDPHVNPLFQNPNEPTLCPQVGPDGDGNFSFCVNGDCLVCIDIDVTNPPAGCEQCGANECCIQDPSGTLPGFCMTMCLPGQVYRDRGCEGITNPDSAPNNPGPIDIDPVSVVPR